MATTMVQSETVYNLEALVSPLSLQEFMKKYSMRRFVHIRGESDRFVPLCTWEQVNQMLDQQPAQPAKLQVVKAGIQVPAQNYIDFRDPEFPVIKVEELKRLLASGSTFELKWIEQSHKPIRNLIISLEQVFQSPAWATFFASWGVEKGFNLHWDNHDVFVVQLEGRKEWKVYPPNIAHPYNKAFSDHQPSEEPVFDSVLERGSLFYIPRGWWHVARPLNEPSLHLAICINTPTGVDFLQWLSGQLRDSDLVRGTMPLGDGDEAKAAYLKAIAGQLAKQLENVELLDQFVNSRRRRTRRSAQFTLPRVA